MIYSKSIYNSQSIEEQGYKRLLKEKLSTAEIEEKPKNKAKNLHANLSLSLN